MEKILEKIIFELKSSVHKKGFDLDLFKRKVAKFYKIPCPSNLTLFKLYHKLVLKKRLKKDKKIEKILLTRPVRSLSGILNVSILTKPYFCPGKCIFCPKEKGVPKSYLSGEPAVERAKSLNYHPFFQVKKRLLSLFFEGHPIDKIELRIIGGTWSAYSSNYQTWFIKEAIKACNQFEKFLTGKSTKKHKKESLKEVQKANEKAKVKIVGITIETRPDFINLKEIKRMRKLGITRVELGVQSIYDSILKLNKRGHSVSKTIEATKLLKDAGFKVCYQMMPNLLGSDLKKDLEMFKIIFENPDFKPDLLKIYPLALVKLSPIYNFYLKNRYKPYSKKELIELLIKVKKLVPFWCRIQRIVRDIPSTQILEGGAKISNLREIVQKEMKKRKIACKCIRCRQAKETSLRAKKIFLFREDYFASGGLEIFLTFEDKKRKKLFALLRLRIPDWKKTKATFSVLKNSAILREVHTYGKLVPTGSKEKNSLQHKGLGKTLIKLAEKIAKNEFGLTKIAVIASIGSREYYRKLAYKLRETYMVKKLK